ncbi:MAG: hypothetical protein ACOC5T_09150 [Elusimicrobiota bacterium]
MENKKIVKKISLRLLLSIVLLALTFYLAMFIRDEYGEGIFYRGLLILGGLVLLKIWNFGHWVRENRSINLFKVGKEGEKDDSSFFRKNK